mmetsp:Transcript_30417/g.45904  ORF Transcript_30417/g.45904 Transcript_30417/m.45904 type:complete len:129 (-) Transcript_30417:128-514(-)
MVLVLGCCVLRCVHDSPPKQAFFPTFPPLKGTPFRTRSPIQRTWSGVPPRQNCPTWRRRLRPTRSRTRLHHLGLLDKMKRGLHRKGERVQARSDSFCFGAEVYETISGCVAAILFRAAQVSIENRFVL